MILCAFFLLLLFADVFHFVLQYGRERPIVYVYGVIPTKWQPGTGVAILHFVNLNDFWWVFCQYVGTLLIRSSRMTARYREYTQLLQ